MITTTTITKQNNGSTDIEECKIGTKFKFSQIEEEKSPIITQWKHDVEEKSLEGPRFCPALYIQRYGFIRKVLEKHHVTSVVDFGCAECKILTLIKTVKSLEKILLVDIDNKLLQSREYCIRPSLDEFLHHRDNPLHIQLLAGSAAILDERIVGVEAVTLVEVIEHLTEDILIEVTENIFNNIQSRLVIITTPNSDFNVLFPNFTGFRHWDHKFEWSRKQFQHWCDTVCCKYGYTVEVTGIGEPPVDSQHVGFCSQAAIFTSLETNRKSTQIPTINYKVISEYHYPYKEKKLSLEDELDIEVLYFIRRQCLLALNDQSEESSITIPVHDLLHIKFVRNLPDLEIFRKYIQKKFTTSQDNIVIDITDFIETDCDSSDNNLDDNELDDDGAEYCNENIENVLVYKEEPDWD